MDELHQRRALKTERDVLAHKQSEERNRGTGRTTRLVDDFIQALFRNKLIVVRDHHPSTEATQYLCDKLQCRMRFEFHKEVVINKIGEIHAEIKLVE